MELRPRYSPHLYIPISSGKEPITKFNIEEWKIISFKGKSPYSAKELVLVEHTATGELVYLTVE